MSFLLDTNVISEWVRPRPDPGVVAWLDAVSADLVYLSVASLAEIHYGIERLVPGHRREALAAWLANDLPLRFEGRILDIDRRVAEAWGTVMVRGEQLGARPGAMDAFFAATAQVHGLTLVTRNAQHFAHLGVTLLDPWSERF